MLYLVGNGKFGEIRFLKLLHSQKIYFYCFRCVFCLFVFILFLREPFSYRGQLSENQLSDDIIFLKTLKVKKKKKRKSSLSCSILSRNRDSQIHHVEERQY